MPQVFVDVGVTLDGFLAGEHRRPRNPLGDGGVRMHEWMFRTATFLERIGAQGGETTAVDDTLVRAVFDRAGAYVMRRRMFDGLAAARLHFEPVEAIHSPHVTHLRYRTRVAHP